MRAIRGAVIALLVLAGPSAAWALTINPNPVVETSVHGGLDATVYGVSISGNVATFQVFVSDGNLTQLDISRLLYGHRVFGDRNQVIDASFGAGPGIGGTASVAHFFGYEARFKFEGGGISAGEWSVPLIVTYASAIKAGSRGELDFHTCFFPSDESFTVVVPEPATLLWLSAALAAGALVRRRH